MHNSSIAYSVLCSWHENGRKGLKGFAKEADKHLVISSRRGEGGYVEKVFAFSDGSFLATKRDKHGTKVWIE